MSLPTPTGNPLPFGPDHFLFDMPENKAWIERERKPGETVIQTLDRMAEELTAWYRGPGGYPHIQPFTWRWPNLPYLT